MNYKFNQKILVIILSISVFLVASFAISRFIIIDNIRDNSLGAITNKWQKANGNWYYYDSSGSTVKGWKQIGGKWYYFDSSGVMASDKDIKYGSETWHCSSSGACTKKTTGSSSSGSSNGWVKSGENWYYYESGKKATGFRTISNKKYYFDSNGVMAVGFKTISGNIYYFEASGQMHTGWRKINNVWYYFNSEGIEQTGFKQIKGVWYYFDGSGVMQVNTCKTKSDGVKLCFDSEGKGTESKDDSGTTENTNNNTGEAKTDSTKNGWDEQNGKWYYYKDKKTVTGWQDINGKRYYFASNGVMLTGLQRLSNGGVNGYYYFNTLGHMKTGWQKINNNWYYFASKETATKEKVPYGSAITGWKSIGGYNYYFATNGVMETGLQYLQYNGKKGYYYFDTSGHMKYGWQKIGSSWYYFASKQFASSNSMNTGEAVTGWKKIGSYNYYFSTSGVMALGLKKLTYNNSTGYFYFDSSGHMKTAWRQINGKWYYFAPNDYAKSNNVVFGMAVKGFQKIKNVWYFFDDNGVMQSNVCKEMSDGKNICFDKNGKGKEQETKDDPQGTPEQGDTSGNPDTPVYNKLTSLGTIKLGSPVITVPSTTNCKGAQGFTVAGNYYVAAKVNSENSKSCIMIYDKNTHQKVSGFHVIGSNSMGQGYLGHTNDIAYNPNDGKLYVPITSGDISKYRYRTIVLEDAINNKLTFDGGKFKDEKNGVRSFSSLEYDASNDKIYAAAGDWIYIYDKYMNYKSYFKKIDTDTSQGIGSYNGKILVVRTNSSRMGVDKGVDAAGNVIDIYRTNGNYLGSYLIDSLNKELEAISYTGVGNTFALYFGTVGEIYEVNLNIPD